MRPREFPISSFAVVTTSGYRDDGSRVVLHLRLSFILVGRSRVCFLMLTMAVSLCINTLLNVGELQGLSHFVGGGGGVQISLREKGRGGWKSGPRYLNRMWEDVGELRVH